MQSRLAALSDLADQAFRPAEDNPLQITQALVVSLDGELIFERYAPEFTTESTFISWSMAKSVASALCGVLVEQGHLSLDAPAPVASWHERDGDPRAEITLRHLLQMRSGLEWDEDYVDAGRSDVIEMLFGSGKNDVAAFAMDKPLAHSPGAHFLYSSGTTNVITRLMGDVIGGGRKDFTKALVDDLLVPAGMTSATLQFDEADTWIGSSFLYARARDFLAFGELYRNDGVAGGNRLLPEGWVAQSVEDHATCPDTGQGYGLQWWLTRDGHGTFSANGYEGQRLQVVPELGLTFVRLGKTTAEHDDDLRAFYAAITSCFE